MFEMPRFEVPKIETPRFEVVDLTVAQVKAMADGELLKLLSGESELKGMVPLPLQQLITSELLARGLAKASKPHWSVVPSFWMLLATVLLALLALLGALVAILALPQAQQIFQPTKPVQTVTPAPSVSPTNPSRPPKATAPETAE